MAFTSKMILYGITNFLMCQTFLITLRGTTLEWFAKLSPKSISLFGQLTREFKLKFVNYKLPKKPITSLWPFVKKKKNY